MIDLKEYAKAKMKLEAAIAKACDDAVAVFSAETNLTPSRITVDMVRVATIGSPVDIFVVGDVTTEINL